MGIERLSVKEAKNYWFANDLIAYAFWGITQVLAEDEGFEPSIGFPIHAFQACALGRYANPPVKRANLTR